jgi:glycosyltransferase involved in cell wall biosynthesis
MEDAPLRDRMTSFSVVIPTRNRPQFLRQSVASVLQQTHLPSEIIIVDDGAGAGEAVAIMSPRISILDNQQRGPVPARNLGVSTATSDFIAFLDDDDWWTDHTYLAQAAALFEAGADFCFADGKMVFENGHDDLPYAFGADAGTLERDNTILISAVTYRRRLHASLGLFDAALPFYWDWDWYLRVARAGCELAHLEKPVVAIRVHDQNMSGDLLEFQRRDNLDALARKHGLPPIPLKNHLDIARHAPGTLRKV